MRLTATIAALMGWSMIAQAQISSFQHVIVIVQENRTPDNLFQGLCATPRGAVDRCSTTPNTLQYNIQTSNWLDKNSPSGVTQPVPGPLANKYDLSHAHSAFVSMCDVNASGVCKMDGANDIACVGTCTGDAKPQFKYVDNSRHLLDPYITMATHYGWANYMFQTNQGPSFPAHQFLFGGTSAPSAADDAAGIYASENMSTTTFAEGIAGCIAPSTTTVEVINPTGGENSKTIPVSIIRRWPIFCLHRLHGVITRRVPALSGPRRTRFSTSANPLDRTETAWGRPGRRTWTSRRPAY